MLFFLCVCILCLLCWCALCELCESFAFICLCVNVALVPCCKEVQTCVSHLKSIWTSRRRHRQTQLIHFLQPARNKPRNKSQCNSVQFFACLFCFLWVFHVRCVHPCVCFTCLRVLLFIRTLQMSTTICLVISTTSGAMLLCQFVHFFVWQENESIG